MLLLYYVVRRFEDGLPLPDFNALRKNDAYWKQWLRVGLNSSVVTCRLRTWLRTSTR